MIYVILGGSTSRSVYFRLLKDTGKVNATPVVYNSSGLAISYQRDNGAAVSVTLVTLSSATAAYSSGGFIHVGNGWYRLDLPNAAIAAGATYVLIQVADATDINAADAVVICLDATVASRLASADTRLPPSAPAGTFGGFILQGSVDSDSARRRQVEASAKSITTAYDGTTTTVIFNVDVTGSISVGDILVTSAGEGAATVTANELIPRTVTAVSYNDGASQTTVTLNRALPVPVATGHRLAILATTDSPLRVLDVENALNAYGYSPQRAGNLDNLDMAVSTAAPTAAANAEAVWSDGARTITGGTITTYTGNTPQTGDAYARLGTPAGASLAADVAAVKTDTDELVAGGNGDVVVSPLLINTNNPRYSVQNLPTIAAGSAPQEAFTIADATGAPVVLAGKALRFIAYSNTACISSTPFTPQGPALYKYETGAGITVGGASGNVVNIQHAASNTAAFTGPLAYWLWNTTDNVVLANGAMPVVPAVENV